MQNIEHSESASLAGHTLSEQAFLRLRRDVIGGAHAPGAKLKLDELQEAYGYSSSPLREALNRLSQEGLVKADDRRGFRVAAISSEDLHDLTHMRLMVEVPALRLAIEHGDEAWEAAVVAAAHRLERAEAQLGDGPQVLDENWSRLHRDFHLCLLSGCPSGRQRLLCASLFDQAERYRRFSARHRVTSRSKSREHKRLLEAVLKRDADTACAVLSEHTQGTQRSVEAALLRMRASAN
ncbi:MAG: FCD domain-containing protein [Hydrogenophaga sp.]|uniref:GntR family transcriptional regulator n=1 Tax=Hydrogenophaga sp. TaxID=1904254 RepID=UPI002622DAEC|nr:FCD domain-containing protein [Hydrogenophaga sp.]MDM7942230.1 FCD domain-containing protein [Hydrogenophaga sp.]